MTLATASPIASGRICLLAVVTMVLLGAVVDTAPAQGIYPPRSINWALNPRSPYIVENCVGPCDCVEIPHTGPVTGTLRLNFSHADTWTIYYDVIAVDLTAVADSQPTRHYSGVGTYEYGGDFALTHRLHLDLTARTEPASPIEHFDSGYVIVAGGGEIFPNLSLSITTGIVGCTRRTMNLQAVGTVGCAGDFNADGTVSVQDIFDYLTGYFSNDPTADFNANGSVTVQDVFDFLAAYFTPCP